MSGEDKDLAMEQANHRSVARNPNHDRVRAKVAKAQAQQQSTKKTRGNKSNMKAIWNEYQGCFNEIGNRAAKHTACGVILTRAYGTMYNHLKKHCKDETTIKNKVYEKYNA